MRTGEQTEVSAFSPGPLHDNESIHEQALVRLRRNIETKIEIQLIRHDSEATARGITPVAAMLSAANQLIQMMTEFKHEVVPCLPRE